MKSVLVISDRDNVATALEPLEPGRRIEVNGATLVVREPVPSGHKIALLRVPAGEAVVKYGSPIGMASADILPGAHVHTHNLSSTRGRGDLPAAVGEPQPRLAEPPDDRNGPGREPIEARDAPDGRAAPPRGEP
ncbi:MAG TPA: UxaA family hydrolase [Vicinamibacterales bacterium]|nr:UxaA family hydrolase [Vicinamibacterales bacterium]